MSRTAQTNSPSPTRATAVDGFSKRRGWAAGQRVVLGVVPDQRLGPAKIADVGDAPDDQPGAVRQDEALLLRDDCPQASFAVGEQLFILVGGAGPQNPEVVAPVHVGLFVRHEIMIAPADQLGIGAAHELAHRLVNDREPCLVVFDKDRMGYGVDDPPQGLDG